MKNAINGFIKNINCLCLIGVIAIGLMTIIAIGGGGCGEETDETDYPNTVGPFGIAVTPNGSYVYVTNAYDDTVSVIRTSNNTVKDTISVGMSPRNAAVTPNGDYVYVTNADDDTVSVIRTSDNTVIDTISVGDLPGGATVTPNGKYVYVANYGDNTVSVIGFE